MTDNQPWTLKRWSYNGHFWQCAPSTHFETYEQAGAAKKSEESIGIKCELVPPTETSTETETGDNHE